MPKAEIITIGTEILLGQIVDTNTRFLAQTLRQAGIDLFWASTVGDNIERIAQLIQQALNRSDIVITTGGLGPTIDDPTREAAALALGVKNLFHEELWQEVIERFSHYGKTPTENNKRQAFLPEGALAIHNPVGTAPAFILEKNNRLLICLPGVPKEMETMLLNDVMPYLSSFFQLAEVIQTRVVRTAGVGESQIDALIADLEMQANPSLGLSAHAGAVDLRITAKANRSTEAEQLMDKMETELRKRLGYWIYGIDEEQLIDKALDNIRTRELSLCIAEQGFNGALGHIFNQTREQSYRGSRSLAPKTSEKNILEQALKIKNERSSDVCLAASLVHEKSQIRLLIGLASPFGDISKVRLYGGPPDNASTWAINFCLNQIRLLGEETLAKVD